MIRHERARNRTFGEAVIDKCLYMTLSITEENAAPYALPLSHVRMGDFVYFHCALEGKKLARLRCNPAVSMVFVGDTQVPPRKFTLYYESAMAVGTATEVLVPQEKRDALRQLCQKYVPQDMGDFDRIWAAWCERTAIWKVSLEKITAKSNFPHE